MQDEGMESAPRTQPALEAPPPPEVGPGHRLPCICTGKTQDKFEIKIRFRCKFVHVFLCRQIICNNRKGQRELVLCCNILNITAGTFTTTTCNVRSAGAYLV